MFQKILKFFKRIKTKLVKPYNKYFPAPNFKKAMNIEPSKWKLKHIIFIILFLTLMMNWISKIDKQIMESPNPQELINFNIILMLIILTCIIFYNILNKRPALLPLYINKKSSVTKH